jgi:hypothetical protein
MSIEQRRFPRFEIRLMGLYALSLEGAATREHSTTTLNVSEGGCELETAARTEPSRVAIKVSLTLSPRETAHLTGTIVWARAPRLAANGSLITPGTVGVQLVGNVPGSFRAFLARLGRAP